MGAGPTRRSLQPEVTGAVMEVTKWLKPSGDPSKKHTASTAGKSMFEINSEPGKPLIVVKTSGLVRADDYVERMSEFEKLVAETHPRGLLFDWTELKGLGRGGGIHSLFRPPRTARQI